MMSYLINWAPKLAWPVPGPLAYLTNQNLSIHTNCQNAIRYNGAVTLCHQKRRDSTPKRPLACVNVPLYPLACPFPPFPGLNHPYIDSVNPISQNHVLRPIAARRHPRAARSPPLAARDTPQAARTPPQAVRDTPRAARDTPHAVRTPTITGSDALFTM